MKFTTIYASALYVASLSEAAKCNADDCARAVTGTFRAQTTSHFADCQSYFACTVTPAAATITSTVTAIPAAVLTTITQGSYPEKKKRDVAIAVTSCPSAVPTYASACGGASRYSSACSCYGATPSTSTLPTPIVTVTSTVTLPAPISTVVVPPSPPALCGNGGLQWAYFVDGQVTPDNSAYDPATHKTDTPSATGTTTYIHFSNSQGTTLYGTPGLNLNGGFAVEHRGYLFAPESGTYTFSATNVDDNLFMWLGPLAYSGWAKGNALQNTYWKRVSGIESNGTSTYTTTLTEGQYYPFRLVTRNRGGPGFWDYMITAPSGYVLIGNNSNTAPVTPFVVQYSCDGTLAPQYPPFGQET